MISLTPRNDVVNRILKANHEEMSKVTGEIDQVLKSCKSLPLMFKSEAFGSSPQIRSSIVEALVKVGYRVDQKPDGNYEVS